MVRPGRAVDLLLTSSSPHSLLLSYSLPKQLRSLPVALRQRVRYREEGEQEWLEVNTTTLTASLQAPTYSLLISPLAPNTPYTVEVVMRPDSPNSLYWGEEGLVTSTTLPARPSRPPRTHPGGFTSHQTKEGMRRVVVYWQELARKEEGGPGFHYAIVQGGRQEQNTTRPYVVFDNLPSEESLELRVWSSNEVGRSNTSAFLQVSGSR